MRTLHSIQAPALFIFLTLSCTERNKLPQANFDLNVPQNLSATVGHEKVDLTWAAPEKTESALELEGYVLRYAPGGGDDIPLDAAITTYEVKGLKNGQEYTFGLHANYGREVGLSGAAEAKATPVSQLSFSVLPGSGFAIAQWTKPASRNDIAGFTIQWGEGVNQKAELDATATRYQIPNLTNETEYIVTFTVKYDPASSSDALTATVTPGEIQPFILSYVSETETIDSPQSTKEVQFTYNSAFLPATVTVVSWHWDFKDIGAATTNSIGQNPTHAFSKPGTYNVSLVIADDQGQEYPAMREIKVWGVKWAYDIGSQIKPQIPAIGSDGTIYIGSEDDNNFHAINPDGTLKWAYIGISDNVYSSASIASDGTIYVGSKDNELHAIAPSGMAKWANSFDLGGDAIFASPAIGNNGNVYIGSDADKLFAVNPQGAQVWEFTTAGKNIRSTPSISDDGMTVYIASDDNNLYALNTADGSTRWAFDAGGDIEGNLALDTDGTIIAGVDLGSSQGAVVAVNPDGSEKWRATGFGRVLSSPAIANDRVYFGTKDDDKLIALSKATGTQEWSFIAEDIILSSPSVDLNGAIYFGSFDGHVYVLSPDGRVKYKYASSETGDAKRFWSSATIGADGTVYIGGYDGKLYAFEFFAEGPANDAWPMFGKNARHTSRR